MNKILGLDIGKSGDAVGCLLTELPPNLYAYYCKLDKKKDFIRLSPCKEDCQKLLDLKPDGIVLEPTGGWYSAFWGLFCERNNITVCWMSHARLKGQRSHFGFSNKTDYDDSICLAASYFDPHFNRFDNEKRFLRDYKPLITRDLWDAYCEVEQLDKIRTANVNRLRQRMALEFPEIAKVKWQRGRAGTTPIIAWLAHQKTRQQSALDKLYAESCCHLVGVEISPHSRRLAEIVHTTETQLTLTETDIGKLLDIPELAPYRKVLDLWGFSPK